MVQKPEDMVFKNNNRASVNKVVKTRLITKIRNIRSGGEGESRER